MRLRLAVAVALFGSVLILLSNRGAAAAGGATPEVLPEATGEGAVLNVPALAFTAEKAAAYEEDKDLPFENGRLVLKGHAKGVADRLAVRTHVLGDASLDKWRRLHLIDGDTKSVCYTEMAGYDRYRKGVPNAGRLDARPYDVKIRIGRMGLDPKTLAPSFADRVSRVNCIAVEGATYPASQGEVHAWNEASKGLAREASASFKDNAAEALALRVSPVETSRLTLRLTPTGSKEKRSFAAREIGAYEIARAPRKDFPAAGTDAKTSGAKAEATFPDRTGVDGAELTLAAAGEVNGAFVLSVKDPGAAEYSVSRFLFSASAKAGEEIGPIALDFGDVVVDKGQTLSIALEPVGGASGLSIASCRVATMEAAKAASEFAEALRKRAALEYSEGAEGWQWESRTENRPDIAGPTFDRILALEPESLLTKVYLNRIRGGKKSPKKSERPDVPKPDPSSRFESPPGAPEWAVAARALLKEHESIMSWWVDERMLADGQMGGGWNDDCELVHRWTYLGLVADSEKARDAVQRYADGIWASGRISHKNGYCQVPGLFDVEHACEETSCTQPYLVLLRYGDPEYVERNMLTISNFDFWTGGKLNPNGHRHFRSVWFQGQAFQR